MAMPACAVKAGEVVSVNYVHPPSNGIISSSHKGPCLVYMAKKDGNKIGGFFKIFQDGYSDGEWCTMKFLANRGKLNFKIPMGVPNGDYVLRTEAIALHKAGKIGGSQSYITCIDISVIGGTNTSLPTNLLHFGRSPSVYSATEPGILFDLKKRNMYKSYVPPGGSVFGSSGANLTDLNKQGMGRSSDKKSHKKPKSSSKSMGNYTQPALASKHNSTGALRSSKEPPSVSDNYNPSGKEVKGHSTKGKSKYEPPLTGGDYSTSSQSKSGLAAPGGKVKSSQVGGDYRIPSQSPSVPCPVSASYMPVSKPLSAPSQVGGDQVSNVLGLGQKAPQYPFTNAIRNHETAVPPAMTPVASPEVVKAKPGHPNHTKCIPKRRRIRRRSFDEIDLSA